MEQSIKNLLDQAKYAISHKDDVLSRKLLVEIKKILSTQQGQLDNQTFQRISDAQMKLKIVNLPNLSENEAANVLRQNYLDSFDAEIDMENRLTALLFFYPVIPRDILREKLKRALMENQQKLGTLTVGQWIQEFEKMFSVKTRNISASLDFITRHPQAIMLNALEKSRLKELLHTYDYLLVTTLPTTGGIVEKILGAPAITTLEKFPVPPTRIPAQISKITAPPAVRYAPPSIPPQQIAEKPPRLITLPFNEALKKYPEFGEQLITSERIRIQNFPDSVRPSIKNWLADYTSIFGYEKTDLVKMEQYLFKSANGKNLDNRSRERLAFMLRAFNENRPVTLQENTKTLVFQEMPNVPAAPASISSVSFSPISSKREQMPEGELNFSYPQKMPFEKQSVPQPAQPASSAPTYPNVVKIPPKTVSPKNVVNLKEL